MSYKGVDVSYANGSIEWSKACKDVDFAIIRSSYGSESPQQVDSQYYNNANGCIKNSVPFGTYHFAYFTGVDKAKDEADFAVKMADKYKSYVKFIALDIEEDSERYARQCGASPDWRKCAEAFFERVKKAGYVPVLYANQSWLLNKLGVDAMKKYKLWLAAPDSSESIPKRYDSVIWQYSWNGDVGGIRGDVDMNICFEPSLFSGKSEQSATKTEQNKTKPDEISQETSSSKVDFKVKITSSNGVNIRSGASTSYKILGAVPYGCEVRISRQTSGGGYSWGLTTYNGIKGWIALDFTKRVGASGIKVGSTVRVKNGALVYGTNTPLSSWVYNSSFKVMEVSGDRVVIGIDGNVTAAVSKDELIVI